VLFRRTYPRVRAYLARQVGAEHAEDAVSETMIRAVRGIDRFELGPGGFDPWLFGIARRVAVDHHRRAGRLRRQDVAAAALDAGGDGGIEGPGERLVIGEEQAELRRAFARLTPGEQEVLELRVVAELSADEAAVVLRKAPGAVRTAQSRALSRLRQLLDAERAGRR